jgi:LL-diaminopimelate aminotransferase
MFLGGASYDLGVAVGNPAVLSALAQLTNHLYTPFFPLMQEILIEPLRQNDALTHECVPHYMRRRDILVEGLQRSGWKLRKPKAGLYVWIPVPPRYSSLRFSVLLRKAGIFTVPGSYMGEYGEEMNEVVRRIDRGVFRSLLRKLPLFHSSLV